MNETELPAPQPNREDGLKQVRMLAHACAISLLILTGTFFVYLYRQTATVRNSIGELAEYVTQYEESNAPRMIEELHIRLDEFRRSHPDFNPIYSRYFGTNPPPVRSGPIAPAPSPGKVVPAPTAPPR